MTLKTQREKLLADVSRLDAAIEELGLAFESFQANYQATCRALPSTHAVSNLAGVIGPDRVTEDIRARMNGASLGPLMSRLAMRGADHRNYISDLRADFEARLAGTVLAQEA